MFPFTPPIPISAKLLKIGESVVICEQLSRQRQSDPVERRVTRIITPGTATEESFTEETRDYQAGALVFGTRGYGLAWLNLSNGEFRMQILESNQSLQNELGRLNITELLISKDEKNWSGPARYVRAYDARNFEEQEALSLLRKQFGEDWLVRQQTDTRVLPALQAAGALLSYALATQLNTLQHVKPPQITAEEEAVIIDPVSRRHLAIDDEDSQKISLFGLMNSCVTPMGSRLLRRELHRPLRNIDLPGGRQQAIGELIKNKMFDSVRPILAKTGDLERSLARISVRTARPGDLLRVRRALATITELQSVPDFETPLLRRLSDSLQPFDTLSELLGRAILEQPAAHIRDGGVIASGYDKELDEQRALQTNSGEFLTRMESEEKQRTGLSSLKIGYNRAFGYYIEISGGQAKNAPSDYMRRQTLKNAERYITPQLKLHEDKILGSRSRSLAREKFLYEEVLDKLNAEMRRLQTIAKALAVLDFLCCLAERAHLLGWNKPQLHLAHSLMIEDGRHPLVEEYSDQPFIANDLLLDNKQNMLIITGPNMGGKSTYMRQTALIVLLAYIGSYVPAKKAEIGRVDRIFTRIGAGDDLAAGSSTFMTEMTETAHILKTATADSLILMDEIGRGTGTYDGLSLAWACADHLGRSRRAYTMFSTHYFELTAIAKELPGTANVHLAAKEHAGGIVFLYKIRTGSASRSYGLQVARLAGVPQPVIEHAQKILDELQQAERKQIPTEQPIPQTSFFDEDPLRRKLQKIEPDNLSPKDALAEIYKLRDLL